MRRPRYAVHYKKKGVELLRPKFRDCAGRSCVTTSAISTPVAPESALRRSLAPRARRSSPGSLQSRQEPFSGSSGRRVAVTSTCCCTTGIFEELEKQSLEAGKEFAEPFVQKMEART